MDQLKETKNESQTQNSELETTQDRLTNLQDENNKQSLQLQDYEVCLWYAMETHNYLGKSDLHATFNPEM